MKVVHINKILEVKPDLKTAAKLLAEEMRRKDRKRLSKKFRFLDNPK